MSPYIWPAGFPDTSPSFREATREGPSGGYADGWTREPGFVSEGPPHPDALIIEAAVEGLAAWRGHGFGPGPREGHSPSIGSRLRRAQRQAPTGVNALSDDPAGLTDGFASAAVDHLQAGIEAVAMMQGLVFGHARAGTRPGPWRGRPPKWTEQLPQLVADKGGNGKPRVLIDAALIETYKRGRAHFEPTLSPPPGAVFFREPVSCPPTRKGVYRRGAYCPLKWEPEPGPLVVRRAEWAGLADGDRARLPGARRPASGDRTAAAGGAVAARGRERERRTAARRSCSRARGLNPTGARHASGWRCGGGPHCGGRVIRAAKRRGPDLRFTGDRHYRCAHRNRLLPISTHLSAEVGQARLRWQHPMYDARAWFR